jgi:hypothetical protein
MDHSPGAPRTISDEKVERSLSRRCAISSGSLGSSQDCTTSALCAFSVVEVAYLNFSWRGHLYAGAASRIYTIPNSLTCLCTDELLFEFACGPGTHDQTFALGLEIELQGLFDEPRPLRSLGFFARVAKWPPLWWYLNLDAVGNHPNVAALVYIAAFALDEGESCASIEQAVPQASKAFKPDGNGNWWIVEEQFAADFAADIPPEKAWFMAISQVPISTDSFTHKVRNPAWKTKPTWYMVAAQDRSINPDQERMMAKRARAKTVEVNASHVAYMSYPKETAKLIEEAATSAHVND